MSFDCASGTPASMLKHSAGHTRHSLPGSSSSMKTSKLSQSMTTSVNQHDSSLSTTKKRGPGRPPKTQNVHESHQVLHSTKRMNSSSTNNNHNTNNFPPTMVSTSPSSFDLNAAFVEMLQQQHYSR
jgi:hypothetical protein